MPSLPAIRDPYLDLAAALDAIEVEEANRPAPPTNWKAEMKSRLKKASFNISRATITHPLHKHLVFEAQIKIRDVYRMVDKFLKEKDDEFDRLKTEINSKREQETQAEETIKLLKDTIKWRDTELATLSTQARYEKTVLQAKVDELQENQETTYAAMRWYKQKASTADEESDSE